MSLSMVMPGVEPTGSDWLFWWMLAAVVVSGLALSIASMNLAVFRRAPRDVSSEDEGWSISMIGLKAAAGDR